MKKTSSLWKIKLRNLTAECENASLWKMFIVQTDVCSDSMSICQMCIRFILVKSCQSLYILAALSRAAGFPLWFHVLILIKDSSCSRLEMKRSDALRWFVLVSGVHGSVCFIHSGWCCRVWTVQLRSSEWRTEPEVYSSVKTLNILFNLQSI